jgi:hypothetical protein
MAEPLRVRSRADERPLVPRRAPPEPLDVASRAVALARSGAPLRRALAAIAGRLVATRAWERLGSARLRDYARERAGVSERQIQELAHVDEALKGLPRIEAAFLAGALSWTQARLLARVAKPEDEEAWLERASQLTARQLAVEVRRVDARALEAGGGRKPIPEEISPEAERVGLRLRLSPRASVRWGRVRMVASRVAGRRLAPWQALELVTAEVLSAIPIAAAGALDEPEPADGCATHGLPETPHPGAPGSEPASVPAAANECATHGLRETPHPPDLPLLGPRPAASLLASLLSGLDSANAFELDARLRRVLHLEQDLLARLGPLLLEIARRRLHRFFGFGSFGEFATEWLGICERKAQALLRLERAAHACPALRRAWREGRLSWVRAHVLVPLLLLEDAAPHRDAWVAHAARVSVRRLEDDVDEALATGVYTPPVLDPDKAAEPQTGARPKPGGRPAPFWISAPRDVARLFRATLASVQKGLELRREGPVSESEAFEAMCEHAFEAWRQRPGPLPREQRVMVRDGWRCAVPGCSSLANLHAHHVLFRSAGGPDRPSNLISLCAWHHQRGVHAGVIRIRGRAPHRLRFELGVRRGRPPLATYLSGDRVA